MRLNGVLGRVRLNGVLEGMYSSTTQRPYGPPIDHPYRPPLWTSYGPPMDLLWTPYGPPMDPLWIHYGPPMDPPRTPLRPPYSHQRGSENSEAVDALTLPVQLIGLDTVAVVV